MPNVQASNLPVNVWKAHQPQQKIIEYLIQHTIAGKHRYASYVKLSHIHRIGETHYIVRGPRAGTPILL